MTHEEIRIAIAEFCGWKHCGVSLAGFGGVPPRDSIRLPYPDARSEDWRMTDWRGLPDYPNDLNAMHEAEKCLAEMPFKPDEKSQRTIYRETLCVITLMKGGPITSTSEHRAEAFLKTIGKYD